MKFTKMQGAGNDYVYVDCFKEHVDDPEKLSIEVSDRHFGIGSDGLILIKPSDIADFKMEIYNADGSCAQMCGNGIRCVGKYVFDRGLTDKTVISVETGGGIKTLRMKTENGEVQSVTVDMGTPILAPAEIPVKLSGETAVDEAIKIGNDVFRITCVSMGNPHAVVFMDQIDYLVLSELGPRFENHPMFPERTNTEFVQIIDRNTIKMRVWERGAGETLACGTGASATLVAAVLNGKSDRKAKILLRGGELEIEWNENDGHVYMTGDAVFVFDGEIL